MIKSTKPIAAFLRTNAQTDSKVCGSMDTSGKVVRNSPSESYKAAYRVLGVTLKPDQEASTSKNCHFCMNLDKSMLDLMVKEGMWILGRGSIKADMPTAGSIRSYIDTSFLQSTDVSRATLK